jgi:ribosomal protein L11 methyltransferase
MTSTLWRLRADGPMPALVDAASRMDELPDAPALSWSVFELDDTSAVETDPDGPGRMDVLFAARPDDEAFIAEFGLDRPGVDVTVTPLPEEDWVRLSLSGLPPVHAGRFVVYGGHDAESVGAALSADEGGIESEAGPAFGTGHDGTTKGCLIAADRLARDGFVATRVLDLGCGTGALAIAAAKLWPDADILATDIDPDAVEETRKNAAKNGVAVTAETADGFDHPVFAKAGFDLIFANILAEPLKALADDLTLAAAPGARVLLSGLMEHQVGPVRETYERAGLIADRSHLVDGWGVISLSKPV